MNKETLKAIPFDALEILDPSTGESTYDRVSYADDIARYFSSFTTNGIIVMGGNVLGDQFKVTHTTGLKVSVATGSAVIDGRVCWRDEVGEDLTLDIGEPDPRIDRIVLELNKLKDDRAVYLKVLKGTAGAVPEAPSLTRTTDVYQISLAQVLVESNQAIIATVTDERPDETVCGIANITLGIKPPTGMDAVTVQLEPETQALYGVENVDEAVIEMFKRTSYSNLTLFKINTTDGVSGEAVSGISFKIVGSIAPTTTNYVTNGSGCLYVLLPYGSYTLTIFDDIIGYDLTPINFSSVSGESYKEIAPIFIRPTTKKFTMDSTKAYKKASYINEIDVFLVGGGGSGGPCGASNSWLGGGGGGGYTVTQLGIDVSGYTEFTPAIGAGGAGWNVSGGQTSFLGFTANGGSFGYSTGGGYGGTGNGGSGGGGTGYTAGAGGSDGSNGVNGSSSYASNGGTGQGTTTREFGEPSGTLYSGGGGGGRSGAGGAGGGGAGGAADSAGGSATFYGGGGGGASGGNASRNGGSGYKGCVVIRWA